VTRSLQHRQSLQSGGVYERKTHSGQVDRPRWCQQRQRSDTLVHGSLWSGWPRQQLCHRGTHGHTLTISHELLAFMPHGAVGNRNPTADLVRTPTAVIGGGDHKWHSKGSLAATLVSPRMMSLSGAPNRYSACTRTVQPPRMPSGTKGWLVVRLSMVSEHVRVLSTLAARSRMDQGSQEFWFRKSMSAVPEPADCWTVSSSDPRGAANFDRGSQEYSRMWMTTTILDKK